MSGPTTDRTASIADLEVAWTESGRGRPVVLLHGLAEDRSTWAAQQRDLRSVRLLAYDLRGHGDTTLGEADATLGQLAADLIGFLEQVSGPATVVGFSLGGTVALRAAAERSDLVEHVVALATSSIVGRAAVGFYADRIARAADTTSEEFRQALREDTSAALAVRRDLLDEVVEARLRAVGDGRGYVNAARAMSALHETPLTPRLADVKAPVHVVGGGADAFCPPKASHIIVDALADAGYTEIPDVGHLLNIDNPDAVTAVLNDVLTGRK